MANWRQLELDFSDDLALLLYFMKTKYALSFQVLPLLQVKRQCFKSSIQKTQGL